MLTSHSLKDAKSKGFHCAIFWLPLVSHSNKQLHEAKRKFFMTVCSRSCVSGPLRLKDGSAGLVCRGDEQSTKLSGSAQNKTRIHSFKHSQTLHAC